MGSLDRLPEVQQNANFVDYLKDLIEELKKEFICDQKSALFSMQLLEVLIGDLKHYHNGSPVGQVEDFINKLKIPFKKARC